MAAKVKTLLDDKALRQSMSKAGREETEKWSWEAATSVLRNVQYQKVREPGCFVWELVLRHVVKNCRFIRGLPVDGVYTLLARVKHRSTALTAPETGGVELRVLQFCG